MAFDRRKMLFPSQIAAKEKREAYAKTPAGKRDAKLMFASVMAIALGNPFYRQ